LHRTAALPGFGSWYCRETRIALWAEIETTLGVVKFVNTHFGLGRAERFLQAQLLTSAEWLGAVASHVPLVLLGDFNSLPGSRTHRLLAGALRDLRLRLAGGGKRRTFPTRFPSVAVDHILINEGLEAEGLQVHRTPLARVASDHYPLVADLTIRPTERR
jgi:endonuclease/exonuclease/phosphatase family metal-dependent hydrolase